MLESIFGHLLSLNMYRDFTKNHFYMWGENIYAQEGGGSIGLRATGSVARYVMDKWYVGIREILNRCKIEIPLFKNYADYVALATAKLQLGERYGDGAITSSPETIQEDLDKGRTREDITFSALQIDCLL